MHVALTGASGFIGSFLARELTEQGHAVIALVRATSRRDHIEDHVERFVTGDIELRDTWDDLVDGADAVIHNAFDWQAMRDDGPEGHYQRNLVAALNALDWSAPRPFVFMSTIAAHYDMRPRWGGQIDEDHPLRPASLYGACKAATEAHLWASHFEHGRHTVAIRPCGVYGIDPSLERSYAFGLIRRLIKGEPVDKPGGGKFVHVEDVARATVAALDNKEFAGQPVNLVDCYARWADWTRMAAKALRVETDVDLSSPGEPKNTFTKTKAQKLGVSLDKGHAGIARYIDELIKVHPDCADR